MPADYGTRDPMHSIYEDEEARRPMRRRLFAGAAAVLVLGAFAMIVYYAYHEGMRAGSGGVAPLIKADQQPYKVKPENPGGMEVPNKDKLIYNELSPNGKPLDQAPEHLLPPPETPMPRPSGDAAASAASSGQGVATPMPAGTAAPAAAAASSATASGAPAPLTTPPASPAAPPAPATSTPPQTASVAPAAPKAAEAAPKAAATGAWRVQLGAMRSAEEAQHEWARLQKAHADLLGSLPLHVQKVAINGKGDFYRIQAGSFASKEAASELCSRLKAAKVGCFPAK